MAELCHLVVVTGPDVPVGTPGAHSRVRLSAAGATFASLVGPPTPFNPGAAFYFALEPPRAPLPLADGTGGLWQIEPPGEGACHLWEQRKGRQAESRCPSHATCPYRDGIVRVTPGGIGAFPILAGDVEHPNLYPLDCSPGPRRASGPNPPIVRGPDTAYDIKVLPPVAIPTEPDEEFFAPGPSLLRRAVLTAPGRAHTRADVASAALDVPGVRDALLLDRAGAIDLAEQYPDVGPPERDLRVTVKPHAGAASRAVELWRQAHAAANFAGGWLDNDPLADWCSEALTSERGRVPGGLRSVSFVEGDVHPPRAPAAESPGTEYPESDATPVASNSAGSWLGHPSAALLGNWLPALARARDACAPFARAVLGDFLNALLNAALGVPDAGGVIRPWLPLARLFELTLARVPGYLLRPLAVNPWPDRLADWWLAPSAPEVTPALPYATPGAMAAALADGSLGTRPVLGTGYLGRAGERFILGTGTSTRLGAPEHNRPADGTVTSWGDLFSRFPLPRSG